MLLNWLHSPHTSCIAYTGQGGPSDRRQFLLTFRVRSGYCCATSHLMSTVIGPFCRLLRNCSSLQHDRTSNVLRIRFSHNMVTSMAYLFFAAGRLVVCQTACSRWPFILLKTPPRRAVVFCVQRWSTYPSQVYEFACQKVRGGGGSASP